MPVYSRQILSGSTNGRPIILNTATAGVEVHTVQATSTAARESLWLWARNNDNSAAQMTLVLISATATNTMPVFLAARSDPNEAYKKVFLGVPLVGTDTMVRAYTATISNAVTLLGFVNRVVT